MEANESSKRILIPQVLEVAKALSSELRLRILEALSEKPMNVTELTEKLGMAQPTISINIQMLESAGLVETTQRLGRGKICTRSCNSLYLELPNVSNESLDYKEIQMPVGLYSDFHLKPSCGMVGREGLVGNIDDTHSFYLPERSDATLLWFSEDGFVEYRFPNLLKLGHAQSIQALSISAELCSEHGASRKIGPLTLHCL